MQLNEMEEFQNDAYEISRTYKERTKRWHDKSILRRDFVSRHQQELLFNSRLKLFPSKLKSGWLGPFTMKKVTPYGAIELTERDGRTFCVNG